MSIFDRMYRISRAYLNHVRERIDSLDAEAARELDGDNASRPAPDDTSVDAMMRRAEERIREGRARDLARRQAAETANAAETAPAVVDADAAHYRVLGVPPGSEWSAVRSAYEKLARRCDPARFPANSEEQNQARRILERVNVAYEALRQRLDPMVNRFSRLELDNPPAAEATPEIATGASASPTPEQAKQKPATPAPGEAAGTGEATEAGRTAAPGEASAPPAGAQTSSEKTE